MALLITSWKSSVEKRSQYYDIVEVVIASRSTPDQNTYTEEARRGGMRTLEICISSGSDAGIITIVIYHQREMSTLPPMVTEVSSHRFICMRHILLAKWTN